MAGALATFSPVVKTETLGVRVREQLRHAIMAGLFTPGEKLTLRAVAASLGVSLTPAREALFNLVAEGILELGGNGSIYIPKLDGEAITELTKIRMSLESLAAREALPNLKCEDFSEWMGHRPALPDTVPILSESARTRGVFYATGHGHLGLTHAATTARLMGELITGARPALDLRPYRINRF